MQILLIYILIGLIFTLLMEILLKIDGNRFENWKEQSMSIGFWPVFLFFFIYNLYKVLKNK
tara:strand:- start:540 stop:722 length:183 start_codon:yes stop_codon:yes gene_type:complete